MNKNHMRYSQGSDQYPHRRWNAVKAVANIHVMEESCNVKMDGSPFSLLMITRAVDLEVVAIGGVNWELVRLWFPTGIGSLELLDAALLGLRPVGLGVIVQVVKVQKIPKY